MIAINQDKVTTIKKVVFRFYDMPLLTAAAPYLVWIISHELVKKQKANNGCLKRAIALDGYQPFIGSGI
jgi:hypothetical protein